MPSQYRPPDPAWLIEIFRGNPLALMVTNGAAADVPFATHLPVILDPAVPPEWGGDLAGMSLLGHMNRANPHWRALSDGDPVLLTFTGPHAYVSPTVYQVTPAAPTWNFTAVHVHGALQKIDSAEETLAVVEATVEAFEAGFGTGWDRTASLGYFRKILPAVGAFRVTVSRADGMFKLSQEQKPEVRARVRDAFADGPCPRHRDTAAMMDRLS